ncbi:MAG: 30S ribosomal protein S4 [Candidatus Gygaella obscura]|nr:30S ribosomal protein S4 [Candidatus Gygaella obscura]
MARYTGAACRLCRREGTKLFLKGSRCVSEKCALAKRQTPPGQHGARRTKLSNYGIQLREKQKVKRMYGVLESQFRRYFHMADKKKGITGEILLQLLERRLDNVIFRAGFAQSRKSARQIVRHNHTLVNSKRVNIPSCLVKDGDEISICNKDKIKKVVADNRELTKTFERPAWIKVEETLHNLKVVRLPGRDDISVPINEQLIVELYSK